MPKSSKPTKDQPVSQSYPPTVHTFQGNPVRLKLRETSRRLRQFSPAEFVARVPYGSDPGRSAGEVIIGVWNAVSTQSGDLFFMTVDGCARRILVRSSSDEDHDLGPCTADERARITVYDGDHATSHAITYKSGLRQFESAAGACVSCEEAEDEELSYELARALPLADRVLYDPGLHKAISLVNLRQPETEPIAIGIPLAIALCCIRLKVAYDKDGWSGSAEFNCTCL